MSDRSNISGMFLIVVSVALVVVTALWKFQESPQQAYKRGWRDALDEKDHERRRDFLAEIRDSIYFDSTDSMKPYVTMEIALPSEIVKLIVDDDTLYFWKQKVDTGYVLKPLYRVHRLWTPEDSMESWEYEEWLDTSRGWGSFDSTDTMPAVERDTTIYIGPPYESLEE